jgi:hypothetical protein
MKTLKELDEYLQNQEWWNPAYFIGYKDAITWILKDIQDSEVLSVEWIEIYLKKLLDTKRNINFTYKWETKCLKEWSNILWINRETLRYNYHLWKHFELIAKTHWLIYKWIDLD